VPKDRSKLSCEGERRADFLEAGLDPRVGAALSAATSLAAFGPATVRHEQRPDTLRPEFDIARQIHWRCTPDRHYLSQNARD
jgi:hypothetical protein